MRIESIRIVNFRAFEDETISLNNYTCLVGPNGAGKSTVLYALAVFFREPAGAWKETTVLSDQDFHGRDTSKPVRITVTFAGLGDAARDDFRQYVRQDRLVVSAVATWDPETGSAPVIQCGERFVMRPFAPFFEREGDGALVGELKPLYEALREGTPELPLWASKSAAIGALRQHEEGHPEDCELIASEDQFYGFSKGTNRLARHVQWVFVPAVKEATSEEAEGRDSAIGRLLARTVRNALSFDDEVKAIRERSQQFYQEMLSQHQGELDDISRRLDARLKEWAHPGVSLRLQWAQDPDRAVRIDGPLAEAVTGEGGFEGRLARFGHGLQRSYLLAVLQELASAEDDDAPTLLLACEEPELYQHPPQMRHLSDVLVRLSAGNSQVIVCTHSPSFVSGEAFEDVRLCRRDAERRSAVVRGVRAAEIHADVAAALGDAGHALPRGMVAKLHQSLQPQLNEILFARVPVLVEGLEDVAYITSYLHLAQLWDEFRRLGCHLVPANGKSELVQPLAVAWRLGLPAFVVFDSDGEKPDRNGSRAKHEKDNKAILTLVGSRTSPPFPPDTLWGSNVVMWSSEIGAVVCDAFGADVHGRLKDRVRQRYGGLGGLEKNSLFIADVLSDAWDEGLRCEPLRRLCQCILDYAAVER